MVQLCDEEEVGGMDFTSYLLILQKAYLFLHFRNKQTRENNISDIYFLITLHIIGEGMNKMNCYGSFRMHNFYLERKQKRYISIAYIQLALFLKEQPIL